MTAIKSTHGLQADQPEASALVLLSLDELRSFVAEVAAQVTRTYLAALTTAVTWSNSRAALAELAPESLPEGWPLAELVAARRTELCLSLAEVARRMRRAAAAEQDHCTMTRQAILRVERERRIPRPSNLRWLAVALDLPRERLLRAARQQQRKRALEKETAATRLVRTSVAQASREQGP